jgi:hypothetical protein
MCDIWSECKARVDGISEAEFSSFRTAQEAMDYVKVARLGRKVNYMNLSVAKTSFVGGRALRAVVRVIQEGETRTHEYVRCLRFDSFGLGCQPGHTTPATRRSSR